MANEKWKSIPHYPGYKISNLGRIKSFKSTPTIILTQTTCGSGYASASLSKDGVLHSINPHRFVGLLFLRRQKGRTEINHKNGIKKDNRAKNLEWVTPSENKKHAYKIGIRPTGKAHHFSKLPRDAKGRCIKAKK